MLSPTSSCAEYYYQKLINNPALEKLHASIKRSYAATLQDDAQQVLNTLLKTGLTKYVTANVDETITFSQYPQYLDRASELLGKEHYMYPILQARKHFFIGKMTDDKLERRASYHQALAHQPDLPQASMEMITTFQEADQDSVLYYGNKASTMVPSWSLPYIKLYFFYRRFDKEKATEMLEKAGEVDPNSVYQWYTKARFLSNEGALDEAEALYKKVLSTSAKGICFPCAHNSLGVLFNKKLEFKKAASYFEYAEKMDSAFFMYPANLGLALYNLDSFPKSILAYERAIVLRSDDSNLHSLLAQAYYKNGNIAEAKKNYTKTVDLDSMHSYAHYGLGRILLEEEEYADALQYLTRSLELDSMIVDAHFRLAIVLIHLGKNEAALKSIEQAFDLGFDEWDQINNAPIFDIFKGNEKWTALLKKQFPTNQEK